MVWRFILGTEQCTVNSWFHFSNSGPVKWIHPLPWILGHRKSFTKHGKTLHKVHVFCNLNMCSSLLLPIDICTEGDLYSDMVSDHITYWLNNDRGTFLDSFQGCPTLMEKTQKLKKHKHIGKFPFSLKLICRISFTTTTKYLFSHNIELFCSLKKLQGVSFDWSYNKF